MSALWGEGVPMAARRGHWIPRAGIRDSCELPDKGAVT